MSLRLIPLIVAALLLAGPAAAGARTVAVTFDDLPYQASGPQLCDPVQALALTRDFLAMLEPLDTHATAFVNEGKVCDARRADLLPQILNLWLDAGVDLGNHTFSHINPHQTTAEIRIRRPPKPGSTTSTVARRSPGPCWRPGVAPCTGSATPICSSARRQRSTMPWPPVWPIGATLSRR